MDGFYMILVFIFIGTIALKMSPRITWYIVLLLTAEAAFIQSLTAD